MATMRATVFHGVNDIRLDEVERPRAGVGDAVIRITLTTICGTDLHIVRGEYPVKPGLTIGHEPVGVIEELGSGVTGYLIGDRVLVGAITPCGQCHACLSGHQAQCGHGSGYEAIGGWRFGNTINGAQAEYLLVPYAQANLDQNSRMSSVMNKSSCWPILRQPASAERRLEGCASGIQWRSLRKGPIGLCATVGAKLMGAALVIGVDGDDTASAKWQNGWALM